MKAKADLVKNAQIRPGEPPVYKSVHDIGVTHLQERRIRVVLIDLNVMGIRKFPRGLVPQLRNIRGVSRVRSTPKKKWDSKFHPKCLRSMAEKSASLRAGDGGLK